MTETIGFKIEMGLVTPQGLYFNNLYYTNQSMFKQRWFELAAIEGSWSIPVLVNETSKDTIFLFELRSLEAATLIENHSDFSSTSYEAYIQSLNSIKNALLELKEINNDKPI